MNKQKLIYYCKCGKKIHWSTYLYGTGLCISCIGKSRTNKNSPRWKGGEQSRRVLCKDCQKPLGKLAIYAGNVRCKSCARKEEYKDPKNNPNWKGGISSLQSLIRGLEKYNIWRTSIFIRDKHTCTECGDNKGYNLNAHHIKEFSKLVEEFLQYYNQFSPIEDKETLIRLAITWQPFWDIDNGKSLCEKCHKNIEVLL